MVFHKNIVIPKHYRVFYSPYTTNNLKSIWILFHGYGENCEDFLKKFEEHYSDSICFIAPEGGSKFYLKGINGKTGVSWMTSDNRENEIIDYVNYLNEVIPNFNIGNNIQINVLAFSQGCHTASRWINQSKLNFSKIHFWGGTVAADLFNKSSPINNLEINHFFGLSDQIFIKKYQNVYANQYKQINKMATFTNYEGDHFITKNNLKFYFSKSL